MTVSRITGMDQLRAAFLAFPRELATKALGQALAKGAVPIRDTAESLAPKATGKLAAAITIAKDQKPYLAGMDARYIVFVKWKGPQGVKYWRYQEFGTSEMAPHPYLRPALEIEKQTSLTLIIQSLSDAVPRIAATLSK